jgi:hypothetical protein
MPARGCDSKVRTGNFDQKVRIPVFSTARQVIALDAVPKWQKSSQEYFAQNMLPSLRNEKKRFSRQNTAITFSVHMDNSMCHNGHRVADELRRLRILRAPHPPYSPDISPCNVWMFAICKGQKKFSRHF